MGLQQQNTQQQMSFTKEKRNNRPRVLWADRLRGITLLSMIGYHFCWDLAYIKGYEMAWYHTKGAYWWQQSICWTFILLSGYCLQFGKHTAKRGAVVFFCGLLVSAVTVLFLPEEPVWFGILTFIGSAMLLTHGLRSLLPQKNRIAGAIVCFVLFLLCKNVSQGYIGVFSVASVELPQWLYANRITAYLGFPYDTFYSADYFPLLPWLFLFWTGWYLRDVLPQKKRELPAFAPLCFLGRHSLAVYLLHQPILYGITLLL